MMGNATWVAVARKMCLGVLAMLMGIELSTGLLLGLLYEPSRMPAVTNDGRPATIIVGERQESVGPFIDTVGTASRQSLVPARSNELIPSAAASSVHVHIANAPAGSVARAVHHTLAGWFVVLAGIVLILAGLERVHRTSISRWTLSILLVIVVLGAAWTGRALPDDIYAEVSLRIVGHELLEAPLGDELVTILGIAPGMPLLARTFFVHILLGAASVWIVFLLWRERQQIPFVVGVSIAAVIAAAMVPVHAFSPRDAVEGLATSSHIEPWWVIRPLHELVSILGAELAGYLVMGGLLVMLLVPVLRRR